MQELKGIAEAELRAIDIWHVQFGASDKAFYNEDDIPAALSVSEAKAPSGNGKQLFLAKQSFRITRIWCCRTMWK